MKNTCFTFLRSLAVMVSLLPFAYAMPAAACVVHLNGDSGGGITTSTLMATHEVEWSDCMTPIACVQILDDSTSKISFGTCGFSIPDATGAYSPSPNGTQDFTATSFRARIDAGGLGNYYYTDYFTFLNPPTVDPIFIDEPLDGSNVASGPLKFSGAFTETTSVCFLSWYCKTHDYGAGGGTQPPIVTSTGVVVLPPGSSTTTSNPYAFEGPDLQEGYYDCSVSDYACNGDLLHTSPTSSFAVVGHIGDRDIVYSQLYGVYNYLVTAFPFNWVLEPADHLMTFTASTESPVILSATTTLMGVTHKIDFNLSEAARPTGYAAEVAATIKDASDYAFDILLFWLIVVGIVEYTQKLKASNDVIYSDKLK